MTDALMEVQNNAALVAAYGSIQEEPDALDQDGSLSILTIVQSDDVQYLTADNKQPTKGFLFHTVLQEEFEKLDTVFFYVKACELPKYGKKPSDPDYWQKNYLVGGCIKDTMIPFWIYVRGMSYNKIWQLSEELAPYRKGKNRLPKCAFTIEVSTELGEAGQEVVNGKTIKYAPKYVYVFKTVRNDAGQPLIEMDPEKVAMYAKMDLLTREQINDYVENNGKSKARVATVTEAHVVSESVAPTRPYAPPVQEAASEDVPF